MGLQGYEGSFQVTDALETPIRALYTPSDFFQGVFLWDIIDKVYSTSSDITQIVFG